MYPSMEACLLPAAKAQCAARRGGKMMRQVLRVGLCALVLASIPLTGSAKVFDVTWQIPGNGLILPSVSTAKCGDTIRFRCPPQAKHGVYKMSYTNHDGSCPATYTAQSSGVVLSAPAKGCDFNLTLGDEPDFFVTSHAPGDCQANLKMNVHSICLGPSVSASDVLGQGSQVSLPGLPGGLLGAARLEAGDQAAVPQLSLSAHSIRQHQQGEVISLKQGNNAAVISSCMQGWLPLLASIAVLLLAAV